MNKYVAEWMTGLDKQEQPVYETKTLPTKEDALETAINESKKAGACDWARVIEYEWVGDKRDGHWEPGLRMVCDWDGVVEENYA